MNFTRIVAFVSVMLGTLALLISMSVLEGFDKNLHENAVKFSSHIKLSKINKNHIRDFNTYRIYLSDRFSEIVNTEAVIEQECLIRHKSNIEGAFIKSLTGDTLPNGLAKLVVSGSADYSSKDANEVIIGKILAEKLNCNVGDSLIIYTVQKNKNYEFENSSVNEFLVSGIFYSRMTQYDELLIFMPFNSSSYLFNIGNNSCTGIDIMLKDIKLSNIISNEIEKAFKYPYYCLTVIDLHSAIFSWIELQKEPIPLILGLISIVAILNVITTLLIMVVEKTQTIGILRTLGISNSNLLTLFVFEGLKISVYGALVGNIISILFYVIQTNFGIIKLNGAIYFLDTLPVQPLISHFVIVNLTALILSFFATIIPAIIALKISPLKAIRFN